MWEDKIKLDLREIVIDVANWIRLAQDRFQWRDLTGNEPSGCIRKQDFFDKLSDNQLSKQCPAPWSI
jgi:hypothetical protein